MPFPRLRIRTLMIAVAVVAAYCWAFASLPASMPFFFLAMPAIALGFAVRRPLDRSAGKD